jgi:hypothetical protein
MRNMGFLIGGIWKKEEFFLRERVDAFCKKV